MPAVPHLPKASPSPANEMPRSHLLILLLISLLGVSLFLGAAALRFRLGFPLDDSWIHQTYARNLALRGEWSFLPGQPSAGSTSPLWTFLLSIGYRLHLNPYFWTWLLGVLTLWAMGVLLESATRRLLSFYRPSFPWVGILAVLEWRMVWMAASGMETLLHALLLTLAAIFLLSATPRYLTLGVIAGLTIWTRPDGLLIVPFLALDALLRPAPSLRERLRHLLNLSLGFAVLFGLYLLFHLLLEGQPWPNTFYAKQAEYLSWQQRPFFARLGAYLWEWIYGSTLLLLPGVLVFFIRLIRARNEPYTRSMWLLLLWWIAFFTVYLLRLPPYHHARYIMPLLPLFLLWGMAGMLIATRRATLPWYRIFFPAWRLSLGLVLVVYFFFGALAYAEEVGYIEHQMVETARWVQANLPPQAVIAAHDIGALGYFDTHPLVDLAGLITPEVIPILNDEQALADYLNAQGVEYLILIQGLYPQLEAGREIIYRGPQDGLTLVQNVPIVVYRWEGR
ncbi:MAG: hypothetical protein WHS87_05640 [Anaerolineales bacterium]